MEGGIKSEMRKSKFRCENRIMNIMFAVIMRS